MSLSNESVPLSKTALSEKTERRLRALYEVFGQINFDLDFERNRVDWSGSDALGYDRQLTGQNTDDWFELVHPDDRPRIEAQLASAQVEHKPLYLELRFRLIDGAYRWYQMRGIPHFDDQGKLTHLVGILEDMTEQRSSGDLAAERDSLARTNDELQEFAYVASHDLQEPLRTITAFVELLNEDHRDCLNREGREYLDFIGEGATRLQTQINDLLIYSRMTSGNEEILEVSLEHIVQEVMENLYASLEDSGAQVQIDPLPSLHGERSRLLLLIQNLLGNALKFRQIERSPVIHLSAEDLGDAWKITIADNGIGIPFEQHERIFHIFHRLHPQSAYDGNGMGLAICAKIVQRQGGRIWVDSVPGRGSRFHFTLRKAGR